MSDNRPPEHFNDEECARCFDLLRLTGRQRLGGVDYCPGCFSIEAKRKAQEKWDLEMTRREESERIAESVRIALARAREMELANAILPQGCRTIFIVLLSMVTALILGRACAAGM